MPKRSRRIQSHSEEDCNQDDDIYSPSDCDSDYGEPISKKIKAVKVSAERKFTAKQKSKAEGQKRETAQEYTGKVLEARDSLHPRSRHSIRTPGLLRAALLRWFDTVKDSRGMPWRKPFDFSQGPEERSQRAYEVWVSEVMLQQTQVATVIPYYNRWMETFPTLRDLARANVDQVNALWKGLGYYSRARRLLEGAIKVSKDYNGKLPDNATEMQQMIPGIGRYSAGAICSIAYGERVPVLDGNVHRLLSRLLALHAPPKNKATLDILWDAAKVMVQEYTAEDQKSHPGDINQALIELGSTVCKVRDPSCDTCPLQSWCCAYELACGRGGSVGTVLPQGHATDKCDMHERLLPDIEDVCGTCDSLPLKIEVTTFPMKVSRKKVREELDIVNVIEWRSDVSSSQRFFLLVKRPDSGLLAGLHDFVTCVDVPKNISPRAIEETSLKLLASMFQNISVEHARLQSEIGHDSDTGKYLTVKHFIAGDVPHTFSHIKKTYKVVWVLMMGGNGPPEYRMDKSVDGPPKKVARRKQSTIGAALQKTVCSDSNSPMDHQWTSLDQVAGANMGTGSMKVWNVARMLWENVAIVD